MGFIRRIKKEVKLHGVLCTLKKSFLKIIYRVNSSMTKLTVKCRRIRYALNSKNRDYNVVISMTSYPPRFNSIYYCLKSLCLQSVKPDKIIVYLGSDSSYDLLTSSMKSFEKYGIQFSFKNENFKSHKKYYYAFSEFPNSLVVTVDDDVFYPRNWLKKLIRSHLKNPESICAWRVHKMVVENGKLQPYNSWFSEYRKCKEPSFSLFPTGVGGVLYPPRTFTKDVLDNDTFMSICENADDVWLKVLYTVNNKKVVWVPNNEVEMAETRSSQKVSLMQTNVIEERNDRFIRNVLEHFKVDDTIFS